MWGSILKLQLHFYLHITGGLAYDATPLMARIALNLGYDAKAYPVDISEIQAIGKFKRDPSTCGFNEYFIADFLRSAIMDGLKPWNARQVAELKQLAGVKPTATLHLIQTCKEQSHS